MASKLGYLIGTTRTLSVEEAVCLAGRVTKGPTVGSVTDPGGAYRYLEELPGIRHMRFAALDPGHTAATLGFEPVPLTATPADEVLLGRLLHQSPVELCYRINILRSDKKLRGGYNAFWDADGTRISIHHNSPEESSISLNTRFGPTSHGSLTKWRELLEKAGFGERDVHLSVSGTGELMAEFDRDVAFEQRQSENPTPNCLMVDANTFSRDEPGLRSGQLTGLTLHGRGVTGDPVSMDLSARMKRIWAAWREALPAKNEFWEVSFNVPIDRWEACRPWINANLPGPYVGSLKWGTATADVEGILKSEKEVGQYVELCWKRIRGRVTIVAAIREEGGWRIQLSGYDELNEAKAAATWEAFLKMAGRDDLFAE